MGLTSTMQRIKCLAQEHNIVPPMRLKPTTHQSQSSTLPLSGSVVECLTQDRDVGGLEPHWRHFVVSLSKTH